MSRDREAWTAMVEGRKPKKRPKFNAHRTKEYHSDKEADVAMKLVALQSCGKIWNLSQQVPFTLVEGQGKIRPITYIADFTYLDAEGSHILDAKGFRTPVYRLKKKLMKLLLGLDIEEV